MSGFVSVLLGILLLGILVTIHEAGHFWAARLTGIAVCEFAVGMGPKLISHVSKKSGIRYSLRAIPLGGFCSFYGEDDASGQEQDDPRAFPKQKVWKRMLTVLMGPGMNFILAFVVMLVFSFYTGTGTYDPHIMEVEAGSPAEVCGLQANDIIRSINGSEVGGDNLNAFTGAITGWQEGSAPLTLYVERRTDHGPEYVELYVQPRLNEETGSYMLGVQVNMILRQHFDNGVWKMERQPITVGQAITESWDTCIYAGSAIFNALKDLFTTGKGFEDTSGPVGVVTVVSQQVREYGMEQFFWLLCLISINLGIMNLLPIPGLDGSRFLFMVYEAIRGKPVPQRKEAMVHLAGMLLLIGLMLFFTFRDVVRLFQ